MRACSILISFLGLIVLGASSAHAQLTNITGLFDTGVNSSNAQLGANVSDTHWTVLNPTPAGASANNDGTAKTVTSLAGGWVANPATSRWITTPGTATSGAGTGGANTNRVAGNWDYELTFNMPVGTQFWTISITGTAAADNSATIYVNGILVSGQSIAGSGSTSSFTLNSSNATFLGGTNSIVFRVNNTAVGATGLLVSSIAGTVIVPEVGSFLPLAGAIGAYGLTVIRRRRSAKAA